MEDNILDEIFDEFEKELQESSGSMAFQKRAISAKSKLTKYIDDKCAEAYKSGYIQASIDQINNPV